jgi:hypothetical protein
MSEDKLSDFEINRKVELIKHPFSDGTLTPGYCGSWADAGTIIEENKISIEWEGDTWSASTAYYKNHVFDKNPLRAAMQTFIKMKAK